MSDWKPVKTTLKRRDGFQLVDADCAPFATGWGTGPASTGPPISDRLQIVRPTRPVRSGVGLRAESEILGVRPLQARPEQGQVRIRSTTFNQKDEAVWALVGGPGRAETDKLEGRLEQHRRRVGGRTLLCLFVPSPRPLPSNSRDRWLARESVDRGLSRRRCLDEFVILRTRPPLQTAPLPSGSPSISKFGCVGRNPLMTMPGVDGVRGRQARLPAKPQLQWAVIFRLRRHLRHRLFCGPHSRNACG